MKNLTIILIVFMLTGGILWSAWPDGKPDGQPHQYKTGNRTEKGKPMFTNELVHETSPYLLQHAHNPVNWMPWGAAAFEKAKREDKPIFLSVGYSTCHWCHVMAHESFEDEGVAKILNEHFISIKVDREELPDVDEQYMIASQLITQSGGGWPNSVWLTPDQRPWFAGTYFPREDRGGMPGFKTLLLRLAEVWKTQRSDIEKQADQVADALRQMGTIAKNPESESPGKQRPLSPTLVDNAVKAVTAPYDERHGGFGFRPKFPPHGALSLLIYQSRKTSDPRQLEMITKTLEAMSLGGIYDHVGGGFHRYSTDERWFLPHFEKMLYDNAQLMRIYADGYDLTGREDFDRVVQETFDWVKREMTDPAGGFYSALDADSLNDEGHAEEGKFYVWTPEQIMDTLGQTDGKFFVMTYGITKAGNFREEASGEQTGDSIPFLAMSLDDVATGMKFKELALRERLDKMQGKLLAERAKRHRPHLDDKVLTDWNGLMIGGLAYTGRVLEEPEYVEAAVRAANFILENLRDKEGRLLRTWRDGRAKLPAYLTDYAFFIQGLLELHQATGDPQWLDEAVRLTDQMIDDFSDTVHGGFFLTSARHDPLLLRSTGMTGGGNIPTGNGIAARVLTRLAALTGNPTYSTAVRGVFEAHSNTMWEHPAQAEHMVLALGEYFDLQAEGKLPDLTQAKESDQPKDPKADATAGEAPVHLKAFVSHDQVEPGARFQVAVQIEMDPSWHIYSNQPGSDIPVKTELTLDSDQATLETVRYPKSEPFKDVATGKDLNTYTGKVTLLAPIRLDKEVKPGEQIELTLKLKAQACNNERCLLPKEYKLPIRVRVSNEPALVH